MSVRLVVLLAALSSGTANAFSVSDCVLNGMKGVSSDAAARQIRWACDQKYQEYKRKRLREFGERLDEASFKDSPTWQHDSPGFHAMRFTNTIENKTVTYARLRVAPGDDEAKPCDFSKEKVYAYNMAVKPKDSVRLIYPSPSAKSECLIVELLLGRSPSWKDVSLSSSVRPEDNDPLAEFDQ